MAKAPRLIEIREFDLVKLTKVDVLDQSFKVQFFCLFAFPGGKNDANLMKLEKDDKGKYLFAFDSTTNKPTWLPSAGWFCDQFDTNNGIDWKILDKDVMVAGEDILFKIRIEGSFYERLELVEFPFDKQDLTISLAVNCRTTGNTPVTLAVAENASLAVDMDEGFQLSQFYTVETKCDPDGREVLDSAGKRLANVRIACTEVGTSADRMFPTMNISVKIIRKPAYYVYNVTVPMVIFNILAFMQFTIAPQFIPERLSISLTLVLTTAAYKFAVASLVPALSYMTFLDEYVLLNWFVTVLVAIAGGTVGFAEAFVEGADVFDDDELDELELASGRILRMARGGGGGNGASHLAIGNSFAQQIDRLVFKSLVVLWLLINLYFAHRAGMLGSPTWAKKVHGGWATTRNLLRIMPSSYSNLQA